MWWAVAGVALGLYALFTVVPLPLWTARALRGRRTPLALGPAPPAPTAPALVALIRDARTFRASVAALEQAAADYRVARPWLLSGALGTKNRGSWAEDVETELQHQLTEATRLAFEWAATLDRLPPHHADRVQRHGLDTTALHERLTAGAGGAVGMGSLSLRAVRRELAILQALATQLAQLEDALLRGDDGIYR